MNAEQRMVWLVPPPVREVATSILDAGGRVMVVGGAVIDMIKGNTSQSDWDVEVFDLSMDELSDLLSPLNPTVCGKSFGVLRVSHMGFEIDLSLPRRDNSIGVGHKDFSVQTDEHMDVNEAASRRDFTINSMSFDLDKLCLVDPFGGRADLENGVIRMTSPSTFKDDPLRVLRAMQLVARKGEVVHLDTIKAARGMDFHSLPKERVMGEWEKLMLKADRPSLGLDFLLHCGWLNHFPELVEFVRWSGWNHPENISLVNGALNKDGSLSVTNMGCPQNPEWHPEGNVWIHTLLVLDAAAKQRDEVDPEWRLAFMFAALLHDVAKPATTVLPKCTAHGHEAAGGPLARRFMERLTNDTTLIDRVVVLVVNHLQPHFLKDARPSRWKRLQDKVGRLDVLGHLTIADWCGRSGRNPDDKRNVGTTAMCFDWHESLGSDGDKVVPVITGHDLIRSGCKPGSSFTPALQAALDAQLDGEESKKVLLDIAFSMAVGLDIDEQEKLEISSQLLKQEDE